jgi:anti-sigma B factor antagonist
MDLQIVREADYVLAETSGPLDESAREPFREKLHPLVGQRGAKLIVDLSGSLRINSAGVGNLVALVADANTQGSRVVLCAVQPFVAGVFSATRLDQYFTLAANRDEAVQVLAR